MDRNTEKAYNDIILGADTLRNEILRLEEELSDLQDRYDILEKEKEEIEDELKSTLWDIDGNQILLKKENT
mgnify:CR=1 FL=1